MIGHFHIPGKATRREYAVYVMVARHRTDGGSLLYVGKTGDNRSGCNPVISRAGNHFSFNKLHSQMRNHLSNLPDEYDFDYFYTTFGDTSIPRSHAKESMSSTKWSGNSIALYRKRLVQCSIRTELQDS